MADPSLPYVGPIVSLAEARESGLKRYFTGKPCIRGHVQERRIGDKSCKGCRPSDRSTRIVAEKQCGSCKANLPVEDFCKSKAQKDGLNNWCRVCAGIYKGNYYKQNAARLSIIAKARYAENPEPQKQAELRRRSADRERYNKKACQYAKNNPDKVNARNRRWAKDQRRINPQFKLRTSLRRRLCRAVKGTGKAASAVRDLGCSIEFLKAYIERQFRSEFNWNNHGTIWHLDHVVPLSWFDLSCPFEARAACHFTNLQPLHGSENIRKGGTNRYRRR